MIFSLYFFLKDLNVSTKMAIFEKNVVHVEYDDREDQDAHMVYEGHGDRLLEAAYLGDLNEVEENFDLGVIFSIFTDPTCIEIRNEEGDTPLIVASRNGHEQLVSFLLTVNEIRVDDTNDIGSNSLIEACENNHYSIVKLLLTDGRIDPNHVDQDNFCCLLTAAGHGHTKVVKELLLDPRTCPNMSDSNDDTSLHYACSHGYLDIVKILYYSRQENINLNAINKENCTPLLEALQNGHTQVVKFLLSLPGIKINQCVLHYACVFGYLDIVKMLFHMGKVEVKPVKKPRRGRSLILDTLFSGHLEVFSFLLKFSGVDKIKNS